MQYYENLHLPQVFAQEIFVIFRKSPLNAKVTVSDNGLNIYEV